MKKNLPAPKALAAGLMLLLLLLVLLSLGMILFPKGAGDETRVAEIYKDGVLIRSIRLSADTPDESFTVTGENGTFNVIEVKEDSIAVSAASCPDKLCVHQGFRKDGQLPITCLPNHLVILIRPLEESGVPDALTY